MQDCEELSDNLRNKMVLLQELEQEQLMQNEQVSYVTK